MSKHTSCSSVKLLFETPPQPTIYLIVFFLPGCLLKLHTCTTLLLCERGRGETLLVVTGDSNRVCLMSYLPVPWHLKRHIVSHKNGFWRRWPVSRYVALSVSLPLYPTCLLWLHSSLFSAKNWFSDWRVVVVQQEKCRTCLQEAQVWSLASHTLEWGAGVLWLCSSRKGRRDMNLRRVTLRGTWALASSLSLAVLWPAGFCSVAPSSTDDWKVGLTNRVFLKTNPTLFNSFCSISNVTKLFKVMTAAVTEAEYSILLHLFPIIQLNIYTGCCIEHIIFQWWILEVWLLCLNIIQLFIEHLFFKCGGDLVKSSSEFLILSSTYTNVTYV